MTVQEKFNSNVSSYMGNSLIPDVVPSRDARMLSHASAAEVGRTQRDEVRRSGDEAAVHDALDRTGRGVRV